MTEPEPLQQVDRTYVRFHGRKLSYFSGCDYFRLASHPGIIAALADGVRKYGLNVSASRLTSGNHRIYTQLEQHLTRFFGTSAALVVSSGYMTNIIVTQALAGNFSHALLDEKCHPSLKDAACFLECPVLQFRHRDPSDLSHAVKKCGPHSKLILLTDGLFSHDGSTAPLREYLKILPADAVILLDDAHAAGILGATGQGSIENAHVSRRRIVQTMTFSKALGVYGGAILGAATLRKKILAKSRMFVGSTPLPLPLANAAIRALQLVNNPEFRRRLFENSDYVRNSIRNTRLKFSEARGPILAWRPRQIPEGLRLRAALLAAGIFPPYIRYPGGPQNGYFRFVISSEHTRLQLDDLIAVLNAHR